MTNVSSVDYPNKRIYLHPDTVTQGFNIIDAYFEINVLTRINANNEQNYPAPLRAEGNIPKGGGNFTARFGVLSAGWRLVPHDADHSLSLLVEVLSDDGVSNRDTFDRSLLSSGVAVDIDNAFQQVEVITVAVGGGSSLTVEEIINHQRPAGHTVGDALDQAVVAAQNTQS